MFPIRGNNQARSERGLLTCDKGSMAELAPGVCTGVEPVCRVTSALPLAPFVVPVLAAVVVPVPVAVATTALATSPASSASVSRSFSFSFPFPLSLKMMMVLVLLRDNLAGLLVVEFRDCDCDCVAGTTEPWIFPPMKST